MLRKNKIAVLLGQQGCGKTSTAIHIMNNDYYIDWKKQKIVSSDDLLAIKVDEETELLVYIDNILDGFIYREKVRKWWHSLCYFYFFCLSKNKKIFIF